MISVNFSKYLTNTSKLTSCQSNCTSVVSLCRKHNCENHPQSIPYVVVCLDQGQINAPPCVYPSNSHNSHTQRLYASCMIAGQKSILHTLPPMFPAWFCRLLHSFSAQPRREFSEALSCLCTHTSLHDPLCLCFSLHDSRCFWFLLHDPLCCCFTHCANISLCLTH
jgi:hypothetical protein